MSEVEVEVGNSPKSELEILKAEIEALKAEKAERKAKEDRLAKIAATEGFKPTRAKLFVRRTDENEIEKLVPDADVFDDIELQEIIRKATGLKRAYTDEVKLAAYKGLKAEGKTDISYDKENECVCVKKPTANANAEAPEANEVTEPEVAEPEVAEPEVAEPEVAEPEADEPA